MRIARLRFGANVTGIVLQLVLASPLFAQVKSGGAAPVWTPVVDSLLYGVAFLARNRFFALAGLILGSIVLAAILGSGKPAASRAVTGFEPEPPRRTGRRRWLIVPAGVALAVVNLVWGTEISNALLFAFGAPGEATVTGSETTGVLYNEQRVYRHSVLIRDAGGRTVETSFEDDDFNVYPSHNATQYPGQGDQFNVRYLRTFPRTFVILGDDSAWARRLRCGKLTDARSQEENKLAFAPDIASFRQALQSAMKAEAAAGCGS
jgi:hypothetical protein